MELRLFFPIHSEGFLIFTLLMVARPANAPRQSSNSFRRGRGHLGIPWVFGRFSCFRVSSRPMFHPSWFATLSRRRKLVVIFAPAQSYGSFVDFLPIAWYSIIRAPVDPVINVVLIA